VKIPTTVRRFALRHQVHVVYVGDSAGGRYELRDPITGVAVDRTRRVRPKPADVLAMCQRYLIVTRHWVIYQLNTFTWKWKAHRPTCDGIPLIFGNKGEALDHAYDYGLAGQRNSFVEYREEPLPPTSVANTESAPIDTLCRPPRSQSANNPNMMSAFKRHGLITTATNDRIGTMQRQETPFGPVWDFVSPHRPKAVHLTPRVWIRATDCRKNLACPMSAGLPSHKFSIGLQEPIGETVGPFAGIPARILLM
jgi:hypothetical protein